VITAPLIRVVVLDDHEMILQSVVRLLAADVRIEVVGNALTAAEGFVIVKRELPDVVVIDYHLPDMDAPEAIKALLAIHPWVKIVTFSGSERPGALYASIRAGSSAWVRKTRAIQELRDAIVNVAAGIPHVNQEMEAQPKLSELVVHYQPVVALDDGHIVGFEALVRWQHPKQGLLYPDAFLPYAEDTGFIEEIDRWVRTIAVNQLARWQGEFPASPNLWMGVNLSACDISNPDLIDSISEVISDSSINAEDLVIEITESVLLDDSERTIDFLRRLKELGVGLAIDDFGTAYSSISYVLRFPFDHLKLDMSFTAELPDSQRSMALIQEICHMADSLKMMSVAEGIERTEQLKALADVGWQYGQGYLFARPLGADDCAVLLTKPTLFPELAAGTVSGAHQHEMPNDFVPAPRSLRMFSDSSDAVSVNETP
jgi:EAL domain-containing protein (putative c-di-GMP-specific phosphodiesterase class I)